MSASSSKQMSPAKKFFLSRIFPWFLSVVGALTVYLGIQEVFGGSKSAEWPTVEGKITTSFVKTEAGIRNRGSTYHAKILYDYTIAGKRFSGNRVSFGDLGTNDPSLAQDIVDRYPEGKRVTVSYNAEDPQESLLEPGLKAGSWFFIWLGLPFLLIGILMVQFLPKLVNT